MAPNGSTEPTAHEDGLNRVLADFLDALGRGERVDLPAWQARYPAFAAELADLLAARREASAALGKETPPLGRPGGGVPPAAPPLGPLGEYDLLEELGHGGMGRVYKARQRGLGRLVALKVIRAGAAATADERLRFRTEAEAAARLDHPNIVPVYEVGEHDGQPYLAARYVEGASLSRHLDRFRDDPRAAAALVAALARAVHHAHQRGVLHRDLKPSNVLLEWRGGGPPVPHVADFGLARLLDQDSGLTRTGDLVGTPSYMAPEQASGGGAAVTTATDVHGLGAILYALLTGRAPYEGPTVLETLERVKGREPDPPRRLNPKVDRDLQTVCLTCLAKDPRRRYASAQALAEDLENWLGHRPIAARPAGARERLAKWVRRHPAATAVACVSAAAVLAALAASLWHAHVLGEALADSDRLRREGLAREARLRDFLYVADMRLAKEAWDSGDLPQLAEVLERQRPRAGEADRRGFEWYWLKWCLGTRAGTLQAHDGGLLCAAVSPDDRFLVTADRKGAVKVWDLASRRPVCGLAGHSNEVQRAVFSPDGRTLATCSTDRTVRLWDVAAWTERACLRGHWTTVTSVAFAPDGKLLASAGRDHRIVLWELPQGRVVRAWQAHHVGKREVVHDVRFTPDGRALVSVGEDGTARTWDVATGAERARRSCPCEPLGLALSADGKLLATGGYGARVSLWTEAGEPRADLQVSWTVRALAFAPSGTQLVAACDSGMLCVWDVAPDGRAARLSKVLRRGGGKGRAAVFARRGALLVTASEDEGTVEFWDPARLGGCEVIPSLPPDVTDVALSSRHRAATSHSGVAVCLLDLEGRRIERTLALPAGVEVFGVALSSDGRIVAAACADTQARLWEVATGRQILALAHGARVNAVAFSPAGGLVATAGAKGTARLWELPSGALRQSWAAQTGAAHAPALCLAFAGDGRTLAVGGSAHAMTVTLWDPATGARQGELRDRGPGATRPSSPPKAPPAGEHAFSVDAVAFSPDGATVVAACSDGVIRLWEVSSGELRRRFSGHVGAVRGLAFAPDGRTLASLGDDKTVKLWHPGTGQQLFTLATHTDRLAGLAFAGDGRLLVAGGRTQNGAGPSALLLWRGEAARP
jgi:WD40 repeat protein